MHNDPLQAADECDISMLPSPMQKFGIACYQANTHVPRAFVHIFHLVMPLIEGISQMQDGGVQHVGDIL